MGNANGKEEVEDLLGKSNSASGGAPSSDSMANSPPSSPRVTRSPLLFAPQVPVAPLHRGDGGSPFPNQPWLQESHGSDHIPPEQGIPVILTWNHGGNEVVVEGSWDNWTSRKTLHRSGKDHSILLVLQSGIYRCKFLVDGEWRYVPDLPSISDESGHAFQLRT